MTVQEMIDVLGNRLEDPQRRKFTDKLKHRTLSNAQVLVANLAADEYLTQLEAIESNATATSGVIATSGLTYKPLRGTEGILNVKNYSGLYCAMLNWSDLKKTENSYLAPSVRNPMAWLFSEAVRLLPSTLAAADVYYRKQPTPLLYAFPAEGIAPPSGTITVAEGATYDLVETDDYYNDSVIFITADSSYHVVTAYVATTFEFTIEPIDPLAPTSFYFVPTDKHDFQLTHLSGVTCDLDVQLHNAVVCFAESECWAMANEMQRAGDALQKGIEEIKALNAAKEGAKGVGVSRE